MNIPLATSRERGIAAALLISWALLYLPNLRTNPNWYGDEGEWMEKSWTFIHGTPRVGPIINDFVFPYPYPPLFMLVNGALLRVFGNDIVVGRALGALTALAAAALLFWVGTRLRDKTFGVVCAAAFLAYSEANMNFRWVRSHPLAGTLALASIGFLVRYVQEKRLRDVALAGAMCALATGTNYFTYPLIGAVVATAACVNPLAAGTPFARSWKPRLWRGLVGGTTAGAYGMLFVVWYVAAHPSGWGQLMAQVGRLTSVASNEVRPTFGGEVARFLENVWTLGFHTPTHGPPLPWSGHDWWLTIATVGFVFLPTRDWRLRLWLPFWLLVLMYGVFKKLNNVPLFFYPATIFLPLMAVGFAGVMEWVGQWTMKLDVNLRRVPAAIGLAAFAIPSLQGAWGHFHSKIDFWTQHSVRQAEAAMAFVNANTTADDFVLVPKQIYWLAKAGKRSMLSFCARYDGVVNDMPVPVPIPRELYWFDCRLQNAKYLVLASGLTAGGRPQGIDLVYTEGLKGVPEVMATAVRDRWQVVYVGGRGAASVYLGGWQWPVTVDGEYMVLANPRFMKTTGD
ncbi:MAG TPA: glycosyltransferase family 39 protein [Verrucomicrobiae bacterium]|nr:glycosyltransferase family 39 protein [Verrucomicrobiae bacterium]